MDYQRNEDAQPAEEDKPDPAQAWSSVRRIREPIAWVLLFISAIGVIVSAAQLLNLVGVPFPTPVTGPGPSAGAAFEVRAAAMGPQFVDFGIIVLPVLSLILVAFWSGLTERAHLVARTAVSIEAVTLVFGVVSWLAALGAHLRPNAWFVFFAADIAFAATALVFVVAVARSDALRQPAPEFDDIDEDDDDDFEDDEDFGGSGEDFVEY